MSVGLRVGGRQEMTELRVQGNATSDELAAVLAVLTRSGAGLRPVEDSYARWRRTRLAARRRDRERE